MEFPLAVAVIAGIVTAIVAIPLMRRTEDETDSVASAELEAAKEAKYREIRDAELDHEMGKLTDEQFRAVDRELRGEAIAILERIDALEKR
ncbi:MAG: hypothetical protein GXY03_13080 [Solirubrobacterales bacterium]|nr:hypothetical protein [Solirubrobacterales bacterium]